MKLIWFFKFGVILSFMLFGVTQSQDDSEEFHKAMPTTVVWVEEGQDAKLFCDMNTLLPGDKVNMVLWFKDTLDIPIYSMDARDSNSSNTTHLALSDIGRRCFFMPASPSHLRISRVTKNDVAIYRCRIDFLNSPTRHYKYNLTLVEFPTKPVILDESDKEISGVAGPYYEQNSITLTCVSHGGHPRPKLSWNLNGENLKGQAKDTPSSSYNTLVITSLPRSYRGQILECSAKIEGAVTVPATTIRLEMFIKPSMVSITGKYGSFVAGKSFQVVCESFGSYPAAFVTWLLNGEAIKNAATKTEEGVISTKSSISIRPEASENGKKLSCRSGNQHFPGYFLEDSLTLDIKHIPIVRVNAISKIELIEGEDLKLECKITSNPPAYNINWYRNEILLIVEPVSSSRNLLLSAVTRNMSGEYACEASNSQGTARSLSISVVIYHSPECRHGFESQSILAMKGESVIVQCDVNAVSTTSHEVRFYWTHTTNQSTTAVPNDNVRSSGTTSVLRYVPKNEDDFGTLSCWAENSIGRQKTPCYFHLIPAKKPSVPENCSVNDKNHIINVVCSPGQDGGSRQYFVLEVRRISVAEPDVSPNILSEISSGDESIGESRVEDVVSPTLTFRREEPNFEIVSLEGGVTYVLSVYAVNLKGRSKAVTLVQKMNTEITDDARKKVILYPSEIIKSSSETTVTIPVTYIGVAGLFIISIITLVTVTTFTLVCRRNGSSYVSNEERELNNFHIMFSEVDKTLDDDDFV